MIERTCARCRGRAAPAVYVLWVEAPGGRRERFFVCEEHGLDWMHEHLTTDTPFRMRLLASIDEREIAEIDAEADGHGLASAAEPTAA